MTANQMLVVDADVEIEMFLKDTAEQNGCELATPESVQILILPPTSQKPVLHACTLVREFT